MSELNLITIQNGGRVSVTTEVAQANAAKDADRFDLFVQSSIKTKLADSGVKIVDINGAIRAIRPPLAPDAKTIYDRLAKRNPPPTMKFDMFRQLLYLYACAGGIKRAVRVHYVNPEG